MAEIEIKDVNLGGISDSMYQGGQNSVAEMVGLDIHSEPGVIKVNQALTEDTGGVVDEFCKVGVACSDGNTYLFGASGGIFKRTSAGTWTDEGTIAPGAGAAAVLGAAEHKGYIYYATQSHIGRWQIGTAWSTRTESWANFTNTDDTYHPMREINEILFIGDAHFVAQIDNGTFSANALDIAQPHRISALGRDGTDLLIGTITSANVVKSKIYRWNTWSVSFTVADELPEVGINAFLDMDNASLISAGTKGMIYEFNGSQAVPYGRIQGIFTKGTTDKCVVNPYSVLNFDGTPLFGVSQSSGNAVKYGLYSLARYSANYPRVFNVDYLASPAKEIDMEYGAIIGAGDVFVVAWKDGASVGVDVLDTANKFSGAYLKTRVVSLDREKKSNFGVGYGFYRSLPASTDIVLKYIKNHNDTEITMNTTNDVDRLMVYSEENVEEAVTVQYKAEFTVNNNDAPEVEALKFKVD